MMRFQFTKGPVAALALLISGNAIAASHGVVLLPEQVSEWKTTTLSLRWVDSLAVSGVLNDGTLKTQWMKRGSRGFSASGQSEGFPLKDVPAFAGANTYRLLGSHVDLGGVYHLTEGLACNNEGSSCTTLARVLSTHTDQGALFYAKTTSPLVSIPSVNNCENEPSLWPLNQGVVVFDGCDSLSYFDHKLSLKSTRKLPAMLRGNGWSILSTPSYDLSAPSGAKPIASTLFIGRMNGGVWERFSIQSDASEPAQLSSIPVDASAQNCEWLSSEPNRIVCQNKNDALFVVNDTGESSAPLQDDLSPQDPKERILTTHAWTAFSQGKHAFVLRAQTITDPQPQPADPKAPAVPPLISEGLRFSNSQIDGGARYQVFSHQGDNTLTPFKIQSSYQRDPGHYYAAALVSQLGRASLSIHDHITQDQPPRWIQSINVTLGSNTKEDLPLLYDDDNHLPEAIQIDATSSPSWALISQDVPRKLLLSPSHSDTGPHSWNVSLSQPDDATKRSDLTVSVNVLLSPYQLTVFETELFKKMKIESPVGLGPLLKALGGRLRVLENDPLIFQLATDGRSPEDVKIDIVNLPQFLQWDASKLELRGTPDQVDVGRFPELTIRVQDRYARVDPETGEPSWSAQVFPLEVLQVDDPFLIQSKPATNAQVDVPYLYELKVSDEETTSSAMDIRLGSGPSWLVFDDATDVLSGTPSVRDVGVHRVQFLIADEGGHVVVHTFEVTVENPQDIKESAGAGLGGLLSLLMALAGWRLLSRRRR